MESYFTHENGHKPLTFARELFAILIQGLVRWAQLFDADKSLLASFNSSSELPQQTPDGVTSTS